MTSVASSSTLARQLCDWLAPALEQGRYPFRKADCGLRLYSIRGPLHPDLVLWINPGSFVAAALLNLLQHPPDNDALINAQAAAEVLGLNHFVLWHPGGLDIYETGSLRIHQHIAAGEPRPAPQAAAALTELLEQLRLLCVLHTRPPEQLGAWHLYNLCEQALWRAGDLHATRLRRTAEPPADLEARVHQQMLLVLALLLDALADGRLPRHLGPQQLATFVAARRSPATTDSLPLPEEAAAAELLFVLHRLEQLSPFHPVERASQFIGLLLRGSHPLAQAGLPQPKLPAADTAALQLYCDDLLSDPAAIDIDHSGRLALKTLLRRLHQMDSPPGRQETQLFALTACNLHQARACLVDSRAPSAQQLPRLQGLLRQVWPGRRLILPPHSPLALWQLAYLLGLLPTGARCDLCLPAALLGQPAAETVLALIHQCCHLEQLQSDGSLCQLRLWRQPAQPGALTQLIHLNHQRALAWHDQPFATRPLQAQAPHQNITETEPPPAATPMPGRQQQVREAIDQQIAARPRFHFPADYLYDLASIERRHHTLNNGPWQLGQQLLENVSLLDCHGKRIVETDIDHAWALLLASHSQQQIELPLAQEACRELVLRYLEDLASLRTLILSESHAGLTPARLARRFATRLWRQLALPPWDRIRLCARQYGRSLPA